MGLLKVSEFAKKYGIARNNVYTYRDREKLIVVDGWIDEENPINKIFLYSRETSAKVKIYPTEKLKPIPEQPAIDETLPAKQSREKVRRATSEPEQGSLWTDHKKTNALRDKKLEEEIRLAKLKNDRTEGRLIPVDIIKRSTSEIIARYKMNSLQMTEQLIRDSLNELLASNEQITSACSKLVDIFNETSKRAVFETRIAIQNIINEPK